MDDMILPNTEFNREKLKDIDDLMPDVKKTIQEKVEEFLEKSDNQPYGLKMSLYDDLKTGLIDKTEFNEFREIYDAKCEELDQTIKYQKQLIREIFDGSVAIKVQIEDWKKAIDIKELDRSLLALTVDAIYVFEDKKIEIHFRYQDMVEKMKIIRDFCLNQVTDNMKEVV